MKPKYTARVEGGATSRLNERTTPTPTETKHAIVSIDQKALSECNILFSTDTVRRHCLEEVAPQVLVDCKVFTVPHTRPTSFELPDGRLMRLPVEDIDVPERVLVELLGATTPFVPKLLSSYGLIASP